MGFTASKATVVGRLGADPELRTVSGGQSVLDLRFCANVYRGKDKDETAVWFKASIWGAYAEGLAKAGMSKGDLVYVSGDLVLEEYTTKDGKVKTQLVILQADVIPMSRGGGGEERSRGNDRRDERGRGDRDRGSPFGNRR